MKKIRALNRSRVGMTVLLLGLFGLMLVLNCLTPYIADDYTYRLSFSTKEPLTSLWDIVPSMYVHCFRMNGRLISHSLEQIFMLMPKMVFNLCNSAVFTGTIYLIYRLCNHGKRRNLSLFVVCFGLFWLFTPAFGQVVLWQVGALNYFWGLTGCVVFIAPYLLRFMDGRELLPMRWQKVLFAIGAFLFGWYSEISSFVGICMAASLMVLGLWMKKDPLKSWRMIPVACAVCGYLAMFFMPAQTAAKAAASMSLDRLLANFADCNEMLREHCLALLLIWAILFVLGLLLRFPSQRLILSGLFVLAGVCANYMPIAASYYPERCMCTTILMLVMAIGFLTAQLPETAGKKGCMVGAVAVAVLCGFLLPSGLRGCRDIANCYLQFRAREQVISEELGRDNRELVLDIVVPATSYSPFYDLRDLSTEDPGTWPNNAMATYYGVDSILGQ